MDATLLQVRLLGRFEVSVAGRVVPAAIWRRRRAATIVKVLALAPGHRLHREQVLDAVWPELALERAGNNLREVLHHARRGLESAGMPVDTMLLRDGDGMLLGHPEDTWVDVAAFDQAAARAWQTPDPEVVQRAIDLYTGDLLPEDLYDDWAASRRQSLRTSYVALLARLAGLYEQRGNFAIAIAACDLLLAAEPLDEGTHAALMRLHAGMGQRELALRQFSRLTELLDRELGEAPDRVTRELAEAIREGKLSPPPVPPEPLPAAAAVGVAFAAQLPAALDLLVGRERELTELQRLLTSTRLLTLTGPGGVGKTRLAQENARAMSGRFPGGVAFVDLSPLRDPAHVMPTIARALSVEESGTRPISELLATAIAERHLLLVLDNLEQVIAAAAQLQFLLTYCPNLSIVATSRVRLRLRGEQEYLVMPLACPEPIDGGALAALADLEQSPAVELFTRRAQAARSDFSLTAGNAAAVVAICRKLDGLPLALELAAARVRVLAPDPLLRRLEQPRDALGMQEHGVASRQRTLREVIDWSYHLLPPFERGLFRSLSIFVGGFALDGAEAMSARISAAERDTLDALSTLIDHSLVVMFQHSAGEGARYGMLETIREFAAEQLAQHGEARRVQRVFQTLLLDLAMHAEAGLRGPDPLPWLDRLELEHDNIRAALGAALNEGDGEDALRLVPRLWPFWRTRGYAVEGHSWLERALTRGVAAPPARLAPVEFALGKLSIDLGDYESAERHFRVSVDLWQDSGDDGALSLALSALTTVKINVGSLTEAEALGEEALAVSLEAGDERGIATAQLNLGMLAREDGRFDRATDLLGASLASWRRVDDLNLIALTAMNLGAAYRAAGQVDRALGLLAESGAQYARLGDRFQLGVIAHNLGHIAREAEHYNTANVHYAAALRHFEAVDSHEGVIESIEWIALTAIGTRQWLPALRLLGGAAAARQKHHLVPLTSEAPVIDVCRLEAMNAVGQATGEASFTSGRMLPLERTQAEALDLADRQAVPSTSIG